ncbi:MAG: hypothetical protein GX091_11115 [Peptococcaceae bacterium]|nr:hypothetical protein [Peptococcaceae bacterium]
MKLVLTIFVILAINYYTFTYARSLWRDDNNKLAACGTALLALLATIPPILMIFIRNI